MKKSSKVGREALDFLKSFAVFWLARKFPSLAREEREDISAEAVRKILPNEKFFSAFAEQRMGEVIVYYRKTLNSEALRYLGRRRRFDLHALPGQSAPGIDPFWAAVLTETRERCRELCLRFASRPENLRHLDCLYLKYRRGLKLEEMAFLLSKPRSTTHDEVKTAVNCLRRFIFSQGIGQPVLAGIFIRALFRGYERSGRFSNDKEKSIA